MDMSGWGGAPNLPIRVTSTLGRTLSTLDVPRDRPFTIYTCGPTVYRPVHLGNLRSYLLADSLRRLLLVGGADVRHVKNITDVGHMRQELLDRGEDKVVAEALHAGLRPQDIARTYTEAFFRDEERLNILPADVFPRATEHVERMVEIARILVERGFAYERDGNVYFRVTRFAGYGELGGSMSREGLRQGVRGEADPRKEDPRDFALWKAAEPSRTELVWDSPWGRGFPGWHIECTAMSTHHLGDQVDVHTGGVDNIFPHHEDERAQSEAYTGVAPFARVWLHGQHLLADGVKMAKSTGNAYTLDDLIRLGFEPLAFRYLCLTAHYRARLNFTFGSLRAAQTGLRRLRAHVASWGPPSSDPPSPDAAACRTSFWSAAIDDLGLPRCLAIAWSLARGTFAHLSASEKAALAREFDRLLALDLGAPPARLPADRLRGAVSSPRLVSDWDGRPSERDVAVNLLVQPGEDLAAVERAVASALRHAGRHTIQVVVVDATGAPETHERLAELARSNGCVDLVWLDHDTGAGGGRNAGLRASRGSVVLLMDASVQLVGDAFTLVVEALRDPRVGAAGAFGLVTDDMRHYFEVASELALPREVDALQGYFLAMRRADLPRVGWLDEHYRFYRSLDLDLSYRLRDRVGRVVDLPGLPLKRHRHAIWESLSPGDRDERSRKNFGRFLKAWDHRRDLLRPTAGQEVAALLDAPAAVHG